MKSGLRPGPRGDVDVPSALLDAAERLFATEGLNSVSLRAVGREAGVSSAGVLYHYSTKDELLAAVIRRRGQLAGQKTRNTVTALLDQASISTRDLVDALMNPLVELINADPAGGVAWVKVLVQLTGAQNEIWRQQLQSDPPLDQLVLQAAARALPALTAADLQIRLAVGVTLMLSALAGADQRSYRNPLSTTGLDAAFVATVASFTAAGLLA